jgi:RimJ/RimL family protein N-acetyltransferase
MTKNKDLGAAVDYTPAPNPVGISLEGRMVKLIPLAASHADALHQSFLESTDHAIWDYLPYGPFKDAAAYGGWISEITAPGDPYFFAILDKTTDRFTGVASYLRINPEAGSIEVGHINFSPLLQSTIAATEVMYVMMGWVFENGYRRYEWKCNALNLKSRAAAQRLGFSYEGVFRQAGLSKGRNRDTAWFGIIDKEWPQLKAAFETWLRPENFDEKCRQHERLSVLTTPIRVASDPALSD